ncbi:hypothetical protein GCM10027203_71670 [Nonomuraea fastidiosa]
MSLWSCRINRIFGDVDTPQDNPCENTPKQPRRVARYFKGFALGPVRLSGVRLTPGAK